MKTRLGFVSNSSTSSFIIPRQHLSDAQIEMIRDHINIGKEVGAYSADNDNAWHIAVTEHSISGYTFMDNFDMGHFLTTYVGVPADIIQWEEV